MPPYHWMISSEPRLDPTQEALLFVLVGDLFVPTFFKATAIREDEEDWPYVSLSPTVSLELKIQGDQPFITELRITPHFQLDQESATEQRRARISSALLREVPLGRLARHAMLGVSVRVTNNYELGDWVVPLEAKDEDGYWYIDALESFSTPFSNEEMRKRGFLRDDYPPQFKAPPWQQDLQQLSTALDAAVSSRERARNRITDEHLEQVARVYRQALDTGIPPKKAVSAELHASTSTAGRWISQARKRGILGPTMPGKKGELADARNDEASTETPS